MSFSNLHLQKCDLLFILGIFISGERGFTLFEDKPLMN